MADRIGPAWVPDSDEFLLLLDAATAIADRLDEDDAHRDDKAPAGG